jgi:hypothetical protein
MGIHTGSMRRDVGQKVDDIRAERHVERVGPRRSTMKPRQISRRHDQKRLGPTLSCFCHAQSAESHLPINVHRRANVCGATADYHLPAREGDDDARPIPDLPPGKSPPYNALASTSGKTSAIWNKRDRGLPRRTDQRVADLIRCCDVARFGKAVIGEGDDRTPASLM